MKCLIASVVVGLLVGMVAIAVAAAPSAPSLNASSILADIRANGAQPVVAALWSDDGRWNQVMVNIGSGRSDWLQVGVALRPGTDAGAAEELDEAIFLALGTAPVAVLKLLKDHQFKTKFVCSSNIGIDYTPTEARRFINERIKILSGLSNEKILATRDECLVGLRAALADFGTSK